MVCLSRPYHFRYFKGCLPKILLGPFLNTLAHMIMLSRGVFVFFETKAQCWTVSFPDRVIELTAASAKVYLVGNFVMFALLQLTKQCLLMVLFFGNILTKSSVLDELIITFYCVKLKASSGKMNPFDKNTSATFT